MADLIETAEWVAGIYQIETNDPVVGGPPDLGLGQGISNVQAQQLAKRTRFLKELTPAGVIAAFAFDTPSAGWLECDGSAISRALYPDLFAGIGTVFGVGDGATTFNIPDLRGEFIRGWDNGRGVDSGRVFGSYQADDFKSHSHNFIMGDITGSEALPARGAGANQAAGTYSVGGSETRPRNVAMMFCIKY